MKLFIKDTEGLNLSCVPIDRKGFFRNVKDPLLFEFYEAEKTCHAVVLASGTAVKFELYDDDTRLIDKGCVNSHIVSRCRVNFDETRFQFLGTVIMHELTLRCNSEEEAKNLGLA